MAEQPLAEGEGVGVEVGRGEGIDTSDRLPTFANFPIFRTIMFLAGFDVNTALDPARQSPTEARYMRIIFAHLSGGYWPDTSTYRRILSSSSLESVSALCIVAAVTVLIRQFYTRAGEDAHAGPGLGLGLGLGLKVEAPILAALCTTFAVITAVYTFLAIEDSCESPINGAPVFEVFAPANEDICAICRDPNSEGLVRLQCYPTDEEIANPQRAFHFVHEDCIAQWWLEVRERWHNGGERGPEPPARCVLCNNRVLGYRPLPITASPGPSNFPGLSALSWALYFFFARATVIFGHLSGESYRGMPRPKHVAADWHAYVITRGILAVFLLLLARLLFARIIYTSYLVFPQLPRFCLDTSQIVYQYLLSTPRLAWSALCSWTSFSPSLHNLVCANRFTSKWFHPEWLFDSSPHSFSLSKGQGWCLAICFLILFFIFIHRLTLQVADAIFYRFPPRSIRDGPRFRTRNSSVALVDFIRTISVSVGVSVSVLQTLIFYWPSALEMGYNTNTEYAFAVFAFIVWSFWITNGDISFDPIKFLTYLKTTSVSICRAVFTLYFAYALIAVPSVALFLAFVTLRDDIFPSAALLISRHFLVKGSISLLVDVIESLGISQFLSHCLYIPFLVPIITWVGGWPLPFFEMRFIEWSGMGLRGYLEPILVIIFEFPAVLKILNLAWSNSPEGPQ